MYTNISFETKPLGGNLSGDLQPFLGFASHWGTLTLAIAGVVGCSSANPYQI